MKNKAHVWMCGLLSATMAFTSCTNFLEEDPKTFLSPSEPDKGGCGWHL